MKHLDTTDQPSFVRRAYRCLLTPQFFIIAISLILLGKVIGLGQLVYGDIPFFSVAQSHVNFLYSWGPEQLGTSVRQGLNTLRDQLIVSVSFSNNMFYFLKHVLPILLLPISYSYIFKKLSITNRFALIVASLFPLFTPIVFGDFITGQTFWIYLTLPWVLYFVIKIFYLHEFTLRHYILLAVMLFLSLGALPPIIVPLVVVLCIFAGFAFLLTSATSKWKLLVHYGVAAVVSLGIFTLLAAPYLLVASSGQQAYTPTSLLGDYYHNYSGTYYLNIFRLAGNNGNGQSTLGYNTATISNVLGYVLFMVTILGAVIVGTARKKYRYRPAILGTLATMLVVLGFLDFMATNMDMGAVIFQSQWIVSTIRNPSKIYTIILPLFTLLVAFCLQNIMEYMRASWRRTAAAAAMVLVIVAYGWPALNGDLGLLYNREEKVSTYKQDPVVARIAAEAPPHSRTLLMPTNHRDELNYQNLNDGLNILRLEGGMPQTSQLIKQLNTSLNARDTYFFNYLTAAGIKDVFVKKDPAAYETVPFTIFPVRSSPEQTADFVATNAQVANETADYWHFTQQTSNDVLFSPTAITAIKGTPSIKTAAPFLLPHSAVVEAPKPAFAQQVGTYIAKPNLAEGQTIIEGKAQLHDPSLLLADMYAVTRGNNRTVIIDVLNPLDYSITKTYTQAVPLDATTLFLGEVMYSFTAQKQRVSIRGSNYAVQSGTLTPVDIAATDPSFETAIPTAHDATVGAMGDAHIYAKKTGDAAQGTQAVLLGSSGHTAFIEKTLPLPEGDEDTTDYVIKFQYKNLRGEAPRFAVLRGDVNMLAGTGSLAPGQKSQWQTYYSRIKPPTDAAEKNLHIFFYTTGASSEPSENAFDDIELYRIQRTDVGSLNLTNYPSDYPLTHYTHHARPEEALPNMMRNGSFEDDALWGAVGDATVTSPGKAHMQASKNSDAHDGTASLQLMSDNHTAFVARTMTHFQPSTVYKLSFFYKHISGHNPSFAVWQEGANIARPYQELKPEHTGWNYYETFFVPDASATNLTLYLYSPSTGEKTINLYDDVILQPTSLIATYLEKTQNSDEQPADILVSATRINPTLIKIQAKAGKGMVVLNESFHAGWKAFVLDDPHQKITSLGQFAAKPKGTEITDHVLVNGFANGWWVDSHAYGIDHDYTILLTYTPQRTIFVGLLSTAVTTAGIGVYLAYDHRRRNQLFRGWRWR